MKIAFFGTPDFAVPSLRALVESRKHDVVCVVTQPDRPSGRGRELTPSPVKKFAIENNIPTFQPENVSKEFNSPPLRGGTAVGSDGVVDPDLLVVVAYGQILRQNVLDYCKHGAINVHASLLPKYRGSSPIQWAIINGETRTGITVQQMVLKVDAGDILYQIETDIGEHETAGDLFTRLADMGASALIETLDQIEAGTAVRTPQDHAAATHFPMLAKTDGKIDFSKPPTEIVNLVRGMNPWPMAYVSSNLGDIRVHRASVVDGKLQLDIVQPPGKRPMPYKEFINGHKHIRFE